MANIFTNFLNSINSDLANTNLKDYRHASKLFVQNFYRLAPKHGFLYFVRFRLNPNVADGETWRSSRQDLELGMLVKKCDLPKVNLDGQTLNIYNRKQPVYTKVTYQPINMTLHDDNKGLVREFWQQYYQYHVADSYYGGSNAQPGIMPVNPLNRYSKPTPVTNQQLVDRANPSSANYVNTTDPARYGLDTSVSEPLIRSIEIYQLSRKQFFLHSLINPKIRSWNMDTLDASKKDLLEHNITIEYEGIYFGQGKVTRYDPSGWTDLHYDLDPSPIGGLFGRPDGTIYGPYGVINDGTSLFQESFGTAATPSASNSQTLASLIQSANVVNNASNVDSAYSVDKGNTSATLTTSSGTSVTTGSVAGLSIPKSTVASDDLTIPANVRNNISKTESTTVNGVTTTVYSTPDGRTATVVRQA